MKGLRAVGVLCVSLRPWQEAFKLSWCFNETTVVYCPAGRQDALTKLRLHTADTHYGQICLWLPDADSGKH